MNQKTIILDKILRAGFVSYLSKSDLEIIKDLAALEDPIWIRVDEYIQNLRETNPYLGDLIAYQNQEGVYIAFVDKQQNQCKIIAF